MAGIGHDTARAEWPKHLDDSRIVHGHDHLAHPFAFLHLVHHMLDQGFTGLCGDNFGGNLVEADARE